jgi:hypothetical protein
MSDHNSGDALDVTLDEAQGPDLEALARALLADARTAYVIYRSRIANPGVAGGEWRPYPTDPANRGKVSPHERHLHLSIKPELRADTRAWGLPGQSAPTRAAPAPSPTPGVLRWTSSAGGLLLRAVERGEHAPPTWVPVMVGDLQIFVTADALRAPVAFQDEGGRERRELLRLPVSYQEQARIARMLGAISYTVEWWNASYAAAAVKVQPMPLPAGPLMGSVGHTVRHTAAIDAYKAGDKLARDVGKGWLLHPRIVERGAVNYGWLTGSGSNLRPIQTPGGRHDSTHFDYSQTCVLVKRFGVSNGVQVDLLERLAPQIPARFLDAYR